MTAWHRPLLVASVALASVGCGLPAFTEAVRDRYGLGPTDIRRIQFFTSGEIVLRREVTAQAKGAVGHELAMVNALRIEEVVIAKRTPCVALRTEGNFVLCGFVKQHPERSLWFAIKKLDETVPSEDRRYELVHLENAPDEPGPFAPRYSNGFLITYAGNKYQVPDGLTWNVHLLYDMKESFDRERVREKPDGWRLDDGAASVKVTVTASSTPATR